MYAGDVLPAFAAIALGTPTLIGLAVWAVVRSGDRDTPTPPDPKDPNQ